MHHQEDNKHFGSIALVTLVTLLLSAGSIYLIIYLLN